MIGAAADMEIAVVHVMGVGVRVDPAGVGMAGEVMVATVVAGNAVACR